MDAIHVANKSMFMGRHNILLVQGISELLKSYWAATKGKWPGGDD